MLPTCRPRRLRPLTLAVLLSLAPAGRALAQMGPGLGVLLARSLDRAAAGTMETTGVTASGDDATAEGEESGALAVAADAPSGADGATWLRASYAGRDAQGVPRYLDRAFTEEERRLLRRQFGIEDPRRLYLSDSLASGTLTYDTRRDGGERDLVSSYRVGAASVRRPGETWEALERRLATTRPESFPASAREVDRALGSLDPVVRPHAARLLAAARQAGFRVRVAETRRSAERQAYLLTLDGHLTHTATSRHADGFALDLVVDDGNLAHRSTRRHWVAFRQWVLAHQRGVFRLIGEPDRSWDWPHLEYVDGPPGIGSIEALLEAARRCEAAGLPDCTEGWRARGPETLALSQQGQSMTLGTATVP